MVSLASWPPPPLQYRSVYFKSGLQCDLVQGSKTFILIVSVSDIGTS